MLENISFCLFKLFEWYIHYKKRNEKKIEYYNFIKFDNYYNQPIFTNPYIIKYSLKFQTFYEAICCWLQDRNHLWIAAAPK